MQFFACVNLGFCFADMQVNTHSQLFCFSDNFFQYIDTAHIRGMRSHSWVYQGIVLVIFAEFCCQFQFFLAVSAKTENCPGNITFDAGFFTGLCNQMTFEIVVCKCCNTVVYHFSTGQLCTPVNIFILHFAFIWPQVSVEPVIDMYIFSNAFEYVHRAVVVH